MANFVHRRNKQPRAVFSASVRKKKTKKDAQMVEHSPCNEGTVMRVEG